MINSKINNDRSGCGLWGERTGFIVDRNTQHLGCHTTTDHSTPSRLTDKYSWFHRPRQPSDQYITLQRKRLILLLVASSFLFCDQSFLTIIFIFLEVRYEKEYFVCASLQTWCCLCCSTPLDVFFQGESVQPRQGERVSAHYCPLSFCSIFFVITPKSLQQDTGPNRSC